MAFLKTTKQSNSKPYSASTVQQYYRTLHTWFEWLKPWLIDVSPLEGVHSPKIPNRRRRNFSDDQVRQILLYCEQPGFTHLRNKAIVMVYMDTAIRAAELANMKKSDIDIRSGSVRVIGKGDKERLVRLSIETRQALLEYLRRRSDGHDALWVSEERKPMTLEGLKTTIRKVNKAAGMGDYKIGPHTFRHTSARDYLKNGGDLRTLQYLMGHTELSTTQIYLTDIDDAEMFKVHERVSPVANLLKSRK